MYIVWNFRLKLYFRLEMGVSDKEETYWPPNTNPFDIDKEWRRRAETELKENPEKAKENVKLLAKKLAVINIFQTPENYVKSAPNFCTQSHSILKSSRVYQLAVIIELPFHWGMEVCIFER